MYLINNKGNWIALKNRLRLAYPIITEDDLKLDDSGGELELLVRLQKKLSKTQKEIIRLMDKL
jgi:hypothetical protein